MTHNITHELDLTDILDGITLEIDFTVDLHERTADEDGDVEITLKARATVDAMTQRAAVKFHAAVWAEINRLMDADELVEAARNQAMITADSKGGRDE